MHWIINNVNQLQNFIEYYKAVSKELIKEAKKPANRILLPIIKQNTSDNEVTNYNTDILIQKIIHKDTRIPIYLAKQQSICLALLMQGKTAKEIAIQMSLSFRTVQHYFERIRHILGCMSNKELIIRYGNQVMSEQWNPIRKLFE